MASRFFEDLRHGLEGWSADSAGRAGTPYLKRGKRTDFRDHALPIEPTLAATAASFRHNELASSGNGGFTGSEIPVVRASCFTLIRVIVDIATLIRADVSAEAG